MSEFFKRNPWMPHAMFTLSIAVIFYAFTANVKAAIRDELRGYVSKEEFAEYRRNHDARVELIIESIQKDIAMARKIAEENNLLLKAAIQKNKL